MICQFDRNSSANKNSVSQTPMRKSARTRNAFAWPKHVEFVMMRFVKQNFYLPTDFDQIARSQRICNIYITYAKFEWAANCIWFLHFPYVKEIGSSEKFLTVETNTHFKFLATPLMDYSKDACTTCSCMAILGWRYLIVSQFSSIDGSNHGSTWPIL